MKQEEDSAEISPLARQLATNSELDSVNTSRTAEQEKFTSTESREAEGARLDAYLNDLRSKYGEAEAMTRFNEYMRSEGYEIAPTVQKPTIGAKNNTKPYEVFIKGKPLGVPTFQNSDAFNLKTGLGFSGISTGFFYMTTERTSDNFTLVSSLNSRRENGQTTHETGTWAQYDAAVGANDSANNSKVFESWKNRNAAELSEKAGFDVAEYLEKYGETGFLWGKAFAAESVNTSLAGSVNSIFADAGIQLEAGQSISLIFNDDSLNRLNVNLNFGDAATRDAVQAALDGATRNNPGILGAFRAEYASVPAYDVTQLDGAFSNGVQSTAYVQQRMFVLSGDEPSTMVMGSGLDAVRNGYAYRKKISDSFDPTADLIKISGKAASETDWHEQIAKTDRLYDEIQKFM